MRKQSIMFTFNKSPKRNPTIPLTMQHTTVPIKSSIKYLGIVLDKNFSFKDHITQVCNKAVRALFPLLNRNSTLNTKGKLCIYKTCIRPIMMYGCQV